MTNEIPNIEPWHREVWSEKEAIAMLHLKGSKLKKRFWEEKIKPYLDIRCGEYYAPQVMDVYKQQIEIKGVQMKHKPV